MDKAERMLLDDILSIKGKKLMVLVDTFAGVGDRAVAAYTIFRDRGEEKDMPLLFYLGVETREHFCALAKVRICQGAWLGGVGWGLSFGNPFCMGG